MNEIMRRRPVASGTSLARQSFASEPCKPYQAFLSKCPGMYPTSRSASRTLGSFIIAVSVPHEVRSNCVATAFRTRGVVVTQIRDRPSSGEVQASHPIGVGDAAPVGARDGQGEEPDLHDGRQIAGVQPCDHRTVHAKLLTSKVAV